jgi:hypothetical protein
MKRKRTTFTATATTKTTTTSVSAFHHLLARSKSSNKTSATSYRRQFSRHHFSSLTPLVYYDTNQAPNEPQIKMRGLENSSPITELVVAGHLIFALTQLGACAVFSRKSSQRLCYLNLKTDETIRSIFMNKSNHCIITVSCFKKDELRRLRCRSTPIEYIESKQPELGHTIFISECLRYPGFVEFDDSNSKVLTYSAIQSRYKLWNLSNYEMLYCITDPGIVEIKMSPRNMLLIYERQQATVQLKMLDIQSGIVLHDIAYPVLPDKAVEFVEQSCGKCMSHEKPVVLTI